MCGNAAVTSVASAAPGGAQAGDREGERGPGRPCSGRALLRGRSCCAAGRVRRDVTAPARGTLGAGQGALHAGRGGEVYGGAPARGRAAGGWAVGPPPNERPRRGAGAGPGGGLFGFERASAARGAAAQAQCGAGRRCPLAPGRGMPGGEEDEAESGAGGGPAAAPSPSPPAEEGDTRQRYEELCSSLNMDERARSEAWLSYQSMKRNYTLEVRGGGAGGPR